MEEKGRGKKREQIIGLDGITATSVDYFPLALTPSNGRRSPTRENNRERERVRLRARSSANDRFSANPLECADNATAYIAIRHFRVPIPLVMSLVGGVARKFRNMLMRRRGQALIAASRRPLVRNCFPPLSLPPPAYLRTTPAGRRVCARGNQSVRPAIVRNLFNLDP